MTSRTWRHLVPANSAPAGKRRPSWRRRSPALWERFEPRTLLDAALFNLSINDVTVQTTGSGPADAVFNVSLDAADSGQAITVDFATADGTGLANVDYTPANGTLTFPAGATSETIDVPVLNNPSAQGNRTFLVNLTNPTPTGFVGIAKAQGQATIVPNLNTGTLAFNSSSYTANATDSSVTITVARTQGSSGDVSVDYATAVGGTAVAGVDYVPTSGTLHFGPNQTSHSFTIPLLSTSATGPDKTINLVLKNPSGGALIGTQSTAVVTIVNQNSLVVTNTADSGPGSLRQAILTADATAGQATIRFDIPGPGTHVIAPTSALPPITKPVTIDGTSQPGFNGTPVVELDGTNAGSLANGLTITGGGSTVEGLAIDRFHGSGLVLASGGGNRVADDFIGVDLSGLKNAGNGLDGITIANSANNLVGGILSGSRNVISGNSQAGVRIVGTGSTGNVVEGNFIGTDSTGRSSLGNGAGVLVSNAPGNTIGGNGPAARNLISGNAMAGVQVMGTSASGNLIEGNFIGTDLSGGHTLGNRLDGVLLVGAPRNTVGGLGPLLGNVISGNVGAGLRVSGVGAVGNVILGNRIGTDASGAVGLGNLGDGILLDGSPGGTIGGLDPSAGNLISANRGDGVHVTGATAIGDLIEGNFIGTDATGTSAIGNARDGVLLDSAPGNTVGGSARGARNLISGNGGSGVRLLDVQATGNVVEDNLIGTDITRLPRLGNTHGLTVDSAPKNTIRGNRIAGNKGQGVVRRGVESPPIVTQMARNSDGQQTTAVYLTFSRAMNVASAENLSNYRLNLVGGGNAPVSLASAAYDPISQTVTLTLAYPVNAKSALRLRVNGRPGQGLTDTEGRHLGTGGARSFVTVESRPSSPNSLSLDGWVSHLGLGAHRVLG